MSFCVFFTANFYSQTAPKTEDVQFWNDTTITFPLLKRKDESDKITFSLLGTFRAGKNISRPIDERIGFGFDFVLNKYLTLSPSYVYRAEQPVNGGKAYEHRIRYDATVGYKFTDFALKNRARFEQRILNSRGDTLRYRNKSTLTVPIKKGGKEIFAPFASVEPHYDFRADKWFRNELSVGIGKKFNNSTSADFFYLWRRNFQDTLKNVNVIGVNLKFTINRKKPAAQNDDVPTEK